MYSAKVLGGQTGGASIQHSHYKAALKSAVKNKKQLPHGSKKK